MKNYYPLLVLFNACIFIGQSSEAQFYYKDIITHQGNLQEYQLRKNNRVQSIVISSFEGNGELSEGFHFQQQFNQSWTQLKAVVEMINSGRNVVINYYNSQGLLFRTTDSSNGNYTVYDYVYDSLLRLVQIQNNSLSIAEKNKSSEIHSWYYDLQGRPERMQRIRDRTDTMTIEFKKDSTGNIVEEQIWQKGIAGEKTFYYYDVQKRVTDIVRFSPRAGKLIPDYMFDYNENGQISQMVTVQQDGRNKTTWVYKYNDLGLKEEEACFLLQKKLAGRMTYQYIFRK